MTKTELEIDYEKFPTWEKYISNDFEGPYDTTEGRRYGCNHVFSGTYDAYANARRELEREFKIRVLQDKEEIRRDKRANPHYDNWIKSRNATGEF